MSMKETAIMNENWTVLTSLFPKHWRSLADHTGAVERLRGFDSIDGLMRTLLIHLAEGYSLRETSVRAKQCGFAAVSDVALLKRLRMSEPWFKALCQKLFQEQKLAFPVSKHGIKMRAVDATLVKEPGKTGSQWRIHYSMSLPEIECDHFQLTSAEGEGHGESLKRYPISKNDCIIGDRGLCTSQGLNYIEKQGGYSLIRVNTSTLSFYQMEGHAQFDLLSHLRTLAGAGIPGEWYVKVKVKEKAEKYITGRLCAVKKSEEAIRATLEKIQRKAKKNAAEVKPETLEFAKYVIVFTTLPGELYLIDEVLEWYRARWQIELVFKRLKSIAGLGHLPKRCDESSRAWLYGKLFVSLITEKLIRYSSDISPWGYGIGGRALSAQKQVA